MSDDVETTGQDVDAGNSAQDQAAEDDGNFQITAQAPEPASTETLGGQIASAVMQLFGISQALAGQVSILVDQNGKQVGFIMFSGSLVPLRGVNLAALLLGIGGKINPYGIISGPSITAGVIHGFESMPNAALGISVYANTGQAVNLDDPTLDMTLTGSNVIGAPMYLGFFPGHIWNQFSGFSDGAGHVMPISWPANRTWNSTGINNSWGLPLVNYTNIVAMFKGEQATLLPDFVWGPDGIYSMRTRLRVVPDYRVGTPPVGFDIGNYGTFAEAGPLLMVWSASGEPLLLGNGDNNTVIDPQTGQILVGAGYADVIGYVGSQLIAITGAPPSYGWNYTGPKPTAANPIWTSTLAGIIGVSDYYDGNSAIMTQAAYQQATNPGNNPGGPEGPGEEGDC